MGIDVWSLSPNISIHAPREGCDVTSSTATAKLL